MKNSILIAALVLSAAAPSYAKSPALPKASAIDSSTPVEVTGDQVEFLQDQQKVTGSGHVSVKYKDVTLTCDRAAVDMSTKEALAEGNVVVTRGADVFKGESIAYNFDKKTATVTNGRSVSPPWYGGAQKIEKLSDQEYAVRSGYVTTCDLDKPHYRIRAKKIRVFPGRKVEAFNVFFFLGKVPIFYMPYFVAPIMDRMPGISVMPGYSKDWGAYALTSFRYFMNEHSKGTVHLDYRERKDFASGLDYKYDSSPIGQGLLRTYYMNERAIPTKHIWQNSELPVIERERYRVRYDHSWRVDDKTTLTGEYQKLSDPLIIKDYFWKEYEQDQRPLSYLSLLRSDANWSFRLYAQKRANPFFEETDKLPEADLSIYNLKIGETPFYYKSDTSYVYFEKEFANNLPLDTRVQRGDTYQQLSAPFKSMGFLYVEPYVATRQTYYSKTGIANEDKLRGIFASGISLSTKFYKALDVKTDYLGLDIDGLRHVITPTIQYSYQHEPSLSAPEIFQYDEVDALGALNTITFGFQNNLQTKRRIGADIETVDLARSVITADCPLRFKDGQSKIKHINSKLEFMPYTWLYFETETQFSQDRGKVERQTEDLTFNIDKVAVGFGHRYEIDNSSQVTGQFSYKISPMWSVRTYHRYEFKGKTMQEQEYAVSRDLHCWLMDIVYNHKPNDHSLWVVFRLKAFPEMPFKFSTSYSAPKTAQ